MTRKLALLLVLSSATVAQAASMWVWKDEKGNTHYSDQPTPGATEQQIPSAPRSGTVPPPRAPAPVLQPPDANFRYTSCRIASPNAEQVFQNESSVSMSIDMQPAKRPQDSVQVSLDGRRVEGWPQGSTSFLLSSLTRGSHSVVASVLDETGRMLCQTPGIQFHVQQPSLLAPQRPRTGASAPAAPSTRPPPRPTTPRP